MRIALLRRAGSRIGGAELYTTRLLAALVEAGHEPHLFAESWPEVPAGVEFHPVTASGHRAERPRRFAEALRQVVDFQRFDCVFSLERTLRQDVYRAGDGVHAAWLEQRRRYTPWWRRAWVGWGAFHRTLRELEARTFSPANTRHLIVNSAMVRREILARFPFPPERIHLVRNGIVVERFQGGDRAGFRAGLGLREADTLLLFVGSGWERKGLRFVLEALRRGPWPVGSVKLLVLGKGRPPWPRPRDVLFGGTQSRLADAYAAADLLVFPPIYEPSANVVGEALAAGLPVITSAFNGAGEILERGVHGDLVDDPANIGALIAAMEPWITRRRRVTYDLAALSLARNVRETLPILEMAGCERRASRA